MNKARCMVCKIYEVAVYLRLSREDQDGNESKTESNSIASQRELIRMFIRDHEDMCIYDIYVEMKIAKLIQFENMHPTQKARNKGF